MIVIVGGSAAGKSTLVNRFIEKHPAYHKVITYTTRPPRDGEKDGESYNFVSGTEFEKMADEKAFLETTSYRGYLYGTAKEDCFGGDFEHTIVILNPAGMRALQREGVELTVVHLCVDRVSRLIQALARGDDPDTAYICNLADEGALCGVNDEADYVIDNTLYHMTEDETVLCLEEILKRIGANGGNGNA